MTGTEKRNALFLIAMLMVIVVILAGSLSKLELQPGIPLPEIQDNEMIMAVPDRGPVEPLSINRFFSIFFGILLGCSVLYMLYQLIRGASWHDILAFLRTLAVIALISTIVLTVVLMAPVSTSAPDVPVVLPTPIPQETAPLGPVPPILLWIVGFALLATTIAIAVWIYRSVTKKDAVIDLVVREAEKARQDLLIGIGLKDVIIRCYKAMSAALERERGIERDQYMTTLEFEERLKTAGVPEEPVRELTRLFNMARYGNWQPGSDDERKAIQCFETIARFSQEGWEAG